MLTANPSSRRGRGCSRAAVSVPASTTIGPTSVAQALAGQRASPTTGHRARRRRRRAAGSCRASPRNDGMPLLRDERAELAGCEAVGAVAGDTIDEPHREAHRVGSPVMRSSSSAMARSSRGLRLVRLPQPLAHQVDRRLDELVGRHAGSVPRVPDPDRTLAGCAVTSRCRRWDELVTLARVAGIEHLGVAPAAVLHRARPRHRRARRGRARRRTWRSHTATRSAPPIPVERWRELARSSSRPARTSGASSRCGPTGPQARVARYAWIDHYAPLRAGLRAIARRLRGGRRAGGRPRRRQLDGRPRGRPTRAGSAGSARTPTSSLPGAGQLVRARFGGHHGRATQPAAATGGRRVRGVPALHRRAARPGRSSRRG